MIVPFHVGYRFIVRNVFDQRYPLPHWPSLTKSG